MSSSNISFALEIAAIKRNLIIYSQVWSLCLLIFGIIGHTLNVYIFTRPKFRHNPCAHYFLASTIFGFMVVLITIPLRMLQNCYNIDVFAYSVGMCKFLSYITPCSRVLVSWFVALASIDRFLCSSSSAILRRWSSSRISSRTIPLTILFICLVYIYLPIYQTVIYPQNTCATVSSLYQSFYGIWNLIFWSWIPTICTFVCGLFITRHIRQGKRRVLTQNQFQQNQKKIDRQLIQMLLFQSFVLGSTTTIVSINNLYVSITNHFLVKNDLDRIKENYLAQIVNYIGSIGACLSFYIFTLSSQLFRRELIHLFSRQRPIRISHHHQTNTVNTPQTKT